MKYLSLFSGIGGFELGIQQAYESNSKRKHFGKELGYTEMPCVEVNLTLDKEQELNLRLNKNTGEWDFDMLANISQELLLDVGFTDEDLTNYFNLGVEEDDFDAEADVAANVSPVAKTGDLWALGRHFLLCGDATKQEDWVKLMQGKKGRLIFTDPPYNVNYRSPGGLDYSSTKFGGTGGKIFNDDKTDEECLTFYTETLKRLHEVTAEDATIYWWFANANNWINRQAFKDASWKFSQIIVWLKNSMVFSHGQDYHRMYEPCMLGWKEGNSHYKNKAIGNYKDVFSLDMDGFEELLDVWYQHRDKTTEYVHPTQKPVRLAMRGIKKNSNTDDIVLDCFGGSGSTMLACEQMGRSCYLMELDPKYCDAIVKRFEKFTGQEAKIVG